MSSKTNLTKVDDFLISPALAIIPRRGDLSKISQLKSALYARQEQLLEESKDLDHEEQDLKILAEIAMLKVVLEYVNPVSESDF